MIWTLKSYIYCFLYFESPIYRRKKEINCQEWLCPVKGIRQIMSSPSSPYLIKKKKKKLSFWSSVIPYISNANYLISLLVPKSVANIIHTQRHLRLYFSSQKRTRASGSSDRRSFIGQRPRQTPESFTLAERGNVRLGEEWPSNGSGRWRCRSCQCQEVPIDTGPASMRAAATEMAQNTGLMVWCRLWLFSAIWYPRSFPQVCSCIFFLFLHFWFR